MVATGKNPPVGRQILTLIGVMHMPVEKCCRPRWAGRFAHATSPPVTGWSQYWTTDYTGHRRFPENLAVPTLFNGAMAKSSPTSTFIRAMGSDIRPRLHPRVIIRSQNKVATSLNLRQYRNYLNIPAVQECGLIFPASPVNGIGYRTRIDTCTAWPNLIHSTCERRIFWNCFQY